MGFNIAGMVINSNYDQDIHKLENDLHTGLEIIRECSFEEASSNWKDDGLLYIHFAQKGTKIFFSHEMAMDRGLSQNHESMSYAYSATAMAFYLSYNNIAQDQYREIMESEGTRNMSQGNALPLETDNPTADGLIFALIDKVLEQNWHEIEMEAKCLVCKAVPFKRRDTELDPLMDEIINRGKSSQNKKSKSSRTVNSEISIEKNQRRNLTSNQKRWWQFWK